MKVKLKNRCMMNNRMGHRLIVKIILIILIWLNLFMCMWMTRVMSNRYRKSMISIIRIISILFH